MIQINITKEGILIFTDGYTFYPEFEEYKQEGV